jgi:hypothetical protein
VAVSCQDLYFHCHILWSFCAQWLDVRMHFSQGFYTSIKFKMTAFIRINKRLGVVFVFLWFCRLLAITVYLFLTFMHKAYASNIRNSTSLAISIYFSLCISYIGTYFFVILFIIYRHIDASKMTTEFKKSDCLFHKLLYSSN